MTYQAAWMSPTVGKAPLGVQKTTITPKILANRRVPKLNRAHDYAARQAMSIVSNVDRE